MFSIKPFQMMDLYFRGGSTQEALDFLNKEKFSDEEVAALPKTGPLVDYDLVCTNCEDLFNTLETEFNKLYLKVINFPKSSDFYPLDNYSQIIVKIFILLNIWRAGASEKIKWNPSSTSMQGLTHLLWVFLIDQNILSDRSKLVEAYTEIINSNSDIKGFLNTFQVITFINNDEIDPQYHSKSNFISCYYSTEPYCIIINRLCILFSERRFDDSGNPKIFKNLSPILDKLADRDIRIYLMSTEDLKKINYNVVNEQIDLTISLISELFDIAYKKIHFEPPAPHLFAGLFPFVYPTVMEGLKHGNFSNVVIEKIIQYANESHPNL